MRSRALIINKSRSLKLHIEGHPKPVQILGLTKQKPSSIHENLILISNISRSLNLNFRDHPKVVQILGLTKLTTSSIHEKPSANY